MFKAILEIVKYKEMLRNSVRKELRARYKGSALGFMWTFINPLLQLAVYSFVFSTIMRVVPPEGVNYTLWLFVALVPWTCVSATILQSTNVIIQNGNLIKKIYFPRAILPLSLTLTNIINMMLTFIIVIAVVLIGGSPLTFNYLFLPLLFLVQFLLLFGFAVLFSAANVFFRDIEHIMSIIVMLWFYGTPIIYALELMPVKYWFIMKLNPLFGIIDSYREILIFGRPPHGNLLLYSLCFALILDLIGMYVFSKGQRRFAEEI